MAALLTMEPIGTRNLPAVIDLLLERNKTLPDYVRWKYGQDDGFYRGEVAFVDGKPAGCFGLVPRELELPNGNRIMCGWFADWYVSPSSRGMGTGTQLLHQITGRYPATFGHPGTQQAQRICKQNGYQEINFQSRRRIILNPWKFVQFRTRHPLKAFLNGVYYVACSSFTRIKVHKTDRGNATHLGSGDLAHFINLDSYQKWIFQQPVGTALMTCEWKEWQKDGFRLLYTENQITSGERRCLILYVAGSLNGSVQNWAEFFSHVKQAGCTYVDLFTTNDALGDVWSFFGALYIVESPVLVHNLAVDLALDLQGWDRENWTFLAGMASA